MASFDTVAFKLHNLQLYGASSYNLIKGKRVTVGGMHYKDLTNKFEETKSDEFIKASLTSASYEINYQIHINQNFVWFEFSFPKWLYLHNVKEQPINEKDPSETLRETIYGFFLSEFKLEIDFNDLEILRFDICHNYVFDSMENKQLFKDCLPDIFANQFGKNKTITYSDNNTVMYKTQDYSFKIYDKGIEFLKHDYTKLQKHLTSQKELDMITSQANLTLRSELTFRKRKISYEFFNQINKTNQVGQTFKQHFRYMKLVYNDTRTILERIVNYLNNYMIFKISEKEINDFIISIYKKPNYLKYFDENISVFVNVCNKLKENKYKGREHKPFTVVDINQLLKRKYKSVLVDYNKTISPKNLFLGMSSLDKAYSKYYGVSKILIDKELMNHVFQKFITIFNSINDFSTGTATPMQVLKYIDPLLKKHNINTAPLKRYFALTKSYSEKELIRQKIVSKKTIYNMKKSLSEINILISKELPNKKYSLTSFDIPEKMSNIVFN